MWNLGTYSPRGRWSPPKFESSMVGGTSLNLGCCLQQFSAAILRGPSVGSGPTSHQKSEG